MRRYLGGLCSLALMLAGCGHSAASVTDVALARVGWCAQPTIAFQDDGVTPAATLTQWEQARSLLGFVPLLPGRLPTGACLVSAGGVVRDPVFGGRFTIIYALPQAGALSIAETPAQQNIPAPECGTAQTGSTPLATCQQTLRGLNVTIFSSLPITRIQTLLASTQPTAGWVPTPTP